MRTIEQQLDAREARRLAAEHRYLTRLEKLEKLEGAAEALVGRLCREGRTVFYINLTDRNGRPTGRIKESDSVYELIAYLIRNKYVTSH